MKAKLFILYGNFGYPKTFILILYNFFGTSLVQLVKHFEGLVF